MKTAVMTDSNSGITPEEGKKIGIYSLPMPVIIEGDVFYEGKNITQEEYYGAMTSGKNVTTSQPSPGDVMDMWDGILKEGYEQVVYIPMSSGLSASCHAAIQLSEEYDGKVQVVDDHRISVTMRESVLEAKWMANQGMTAEEIKKIPESITGQYLSGKKKIEVPKKRRKSNGKCIQIVKASENNLKNINVKIPLGQFVCVTGVSGSGKSTLINEILYKTVARDLNGANEKPGKCKEIKGLENIDKIINIDQSPIGRTPRSNPATYTGVFDSIRDIFASTNDAKLRGFDKGRFSFNVTGGRCENCNGDGLIKIEMHFLPDIYVPCEVCKGKRYNHETLQVKYKGKTISDVLEMTVEDALKFFENIPKIKNKIQTLYDVGLGYIKLGQPSTTLSGGEAQRVKLATELSKKATGKTLYILDEPTTGLHIADVHKLVDILQRLVDTGNSIVVIEHNLDLIKTSDYIIDLGPEGGEAGGTIVATGTPEKIVQVEESYTGKFLKPYLKK